MIELAGEEGDPDLDSIVEDVVRNQQEELKESETEMAKKDEK